MICVCGLICDCIRGVNFLARIARGAIVASSVNWEYPWNLRYLLKTFPLVLIMKREGICLMNKVRTWIQERLWPSFLVTQSTRYQSGELSYLSGFHPPKHHFSLENPGRKIKPPSELELWAGLCPNLEMGTCEIGMIFPPRTSKQLFTEIQSFEVYPG